MVAQRKQVRELKAKQKKQATEDKKAQKQVDEQLKNDLQLATPKLKKTSRSHKTQKRVVFEEDLDIEEEVVQIRTPRPRRERRAPKGLDGYEYYVE